jgi:hypothetical protein
MNRIARTAAALLLMVAAVSCNDINRREAPVALVVTTNQILHRLDLAGDPVGSTNCQKDIATILMTSVLLQTPSTIAGVTQANLNQIKVDRYRVSYVRLDGGRLVPASFVRSISTTVAGSTSGPTTFVLIEPNAIFQAPFAALQQIGGRDPETGKTTITMDVILEVFGTTLAGERVTGNTRMTLDFCFSCGGCA